MHDEPLRQPPQDEEEEIPPVAKILGFVALLIVITVLALWAHSPKTADDPSYEEAVRKTVWTTNVIGNPNTYVLAGVRPSQSSENIICGRINFERVDNRGWSGFRDFYVELGVIYLVLPNSEKEKTFNFYCLAAPTTPAPEPSSGNL